MSPPGFYGKVPVLGDFVTRRLPRSFVQAWDDWLQSSIATSREQMGLRWLDHYLISPIWRFALSPGLCSETAWAGVMMPSVDRVGRYFPLTLACPINDPTALPGLFEAPGEWFCCLEKLALSALEDCFDLEHFDARLLALGAPGGVPADGEEENSAEPAQSGRLALRLNLGDIGQSTRGLVSLSAHLLRDFFPNYSLWTTVGSDCIESTMLVCQGLPPVDAYVALISGQWQQRGWALRTLPLLRVGQRVPEQTAAADGAETSRWHSDALSVTGHKRSRNEDAFLNQPERGLWAVADGMGGHQAGEIASRKIVEALAAIRLPFGLEERVAVVRACLAGVSRELCGLAAASSTRQVIGSTVVVLLAACGRCAYLWAGDSRLYRLRQGHLEQLTCDHVLIQEGEEDWLVEPGEPSEARKHCNVITRAVGADENLDLDIGLCDVFPGDRFLLCSDGLDKELSTIEIGAQLAQGDCRASVKALIEAALAREGRDNVTVVVVDAKSEEGVQIEK